MIFVLISARTYRYEYYSTMLDVFKFFCALKSIFGEGACGNDACREEDVRGNRGGAGDGLHRLGWKKVGDGEATERVGGK